MTKIERACLDEYLLHKDEEDEDFVRETVIDLKKQLKSIQTTLDNSNIGSGHTLSRTTSVIIPDDQKGGDNRVHAKETFANALIKKSKVEIAYPIELHVNSRQSPYYKTDIQRHEVLDNKVLWEVEWEDYRPPEYSKDRSNAAKRGKEDGGPHGPYDDDELCEDVYTRFNKNNEERGGLNRKSYVGKYQLEDNTKRPINPRGRTGLRGKGQLKRWGPNHEADVIVTRWLRDKNNRIVHAGQDGDGKAILEFVAIKKHKDDKQWAIPGGRVHTGERLVDTLEREFSEEALGATEMPEEQRQTCLKMVESHFGLGITVFRGYVDDPRNTDNSWVETTAISYHDSDGTSFAKFPLDMGFEVKPKQARWITLDKNIDLFANHEWIVEKVCFHRNAYCPISLMEDSTDGKVKLGMVGKKLSSKWACVVEE